MPDQNHEIIAIAGPSGVGKSGASYPLARHLGIPIVEVDDLFHAVEALTTPAQQPLIHFWQTHPEAAGLPAEEILAQHIEVCRALSPAIAAVIDNHIRTRMPIVLEGDYILPELAAEYPNQVKAVFLYEEDPDQIVRNFLNREPAQGEQHKRAQVSALFGTWLRAECKRLDLVALPSRPWDTTVERIIASIGRSP